MEISKGNLLEETHYYPFGLPIAGLGSVDVPQNFKENRHKYQGNEYIKAIGLNWMDFQARQYDPQIGRFLGVDPLAASGGQDMFSPYAAMGNAPESTIDPNGEMFQPAKGATSFYAANDKLYRGDEGGPGSGGGGGSGTGGDAIWDALGAFGRGGSQNTFTTANDIAKVWSMLIGGASVDKISTAFSSGGDGDGNGVGGIQAAFFRLGGDFAFGSGDPGAGGGENKNKKYTILSNDPYKESKFDGLIEYKGLDFELVYTGSLAGYSDVDWIQSVTTNKPSDGKPTNKAYLDGNPYAPNPPFYFSKNGWDRDKANELGSQYGGKYFADAPSRTSKSAPYYWYAELSLVGKKDGVYQNIATFQWGYYYFNNWIIPLAPQLISPSQFQQSLFPKK